MKNKDIKYIINDRLRAEMSKRGSKTKRKMDIIHFSDTNKNDIKHIKEGGKSSG